MIVSLTQAERDKFVTWLKHEAETDRGMIEQFSKLPTGNPLENKMKRDMAAKIIVAGILDSIEEMTIGGESA